MYSASLCPHFNGVGRFWRWLCAYLLTDQAYAVAIMRYGEEDGKKLKLWFYLGCALPLWVLWQAGTVIGVIVGIKIPASWALDFAVPLTFMAIMLPNLRDAATVVSAITSGFVSVTAFRLPMNLAIIVSIVAGILTGFTLETVALKKASQKKR